MELRSLRYYLAVCEWGTMSRAAEELHVTQPALSRQIAALGGRPSVTQWKRAGEPFPGADGMPRTDLILTPVTGRTHQLRLHCAHSAGLGAPIEGDPYYSPAGLAAESPETPLLLHAGLLDFEDPASGRRVRFFRPPAFRPDLQERAFDR